MPLGDRWNREKGGFQVIKLFENEFIAAAAAAAAAAVAVTAMAEGEGGEGGSTQICFYGLLYTGKTRE